MPVVRKNRKHEDTELMHLYETEKGDRWVCEYCAREEAEMIASKGWEYIFDRQEQDLVCSICGKPQFTPDD